MFPVASVKVVYERDPTHSTVRRICSIDAVRDRSSDTSAAARCWASRVFSARCSYRRTEMQADMVRELAERYPYITEMVMAITHDEESVVGQGCDDQFEFEFALDLMLDGLERLRDTA
jgi:hypothetical protein